MLFFFVACLFACFGWVLNRRSVVVTEVMENGSHTHDKTDTHDSLLSSSSVTSEHDEEAAYTSPTPSPFPAYSDTLSSSPLDDTFDVTSPVPSKQIAKEEGIVKRIQSAVNKET